VPEKLTENDLKELCGDKYDPAVYQAEKEEDGSFSREKFMKLSAGLIDDTADNKDPSLEDDDGKAAAAKAERMHSKAQIEKSELDQALEAFGAGTGGAELKLKSIACMELNSKEFFSLDKLDPYVCVSVNDKQTFITEPQIDAGESATWSDLEYKAIAKKKHVLEGAISVEVWDKNYAIRDKLIGYAVVPLGLLADHVNKDEVITSNIMSNGEVTGRIIIVAKLDVSRLIEHEKIGSIQSVAEAHSKISPIDGDVTSQKDDLINFISTFHGGIVTILSFAVMQMESIGFLDKLDPYLCVSVSDTTLKTEPQIDAGDRATWEEISYEVPCTEKQIGEGFINIEVWDKNVLTSDVIVGHASIPLHIFETQLDTEVVLTGSIMLKDEKRGKMVLVAKFKPYEMIKEEEKSFEEAALLAAQMMIKNEEMAKEQQKLSTEIFDEGSGQAMLKLCSVCALDLKMRGFLSLDKLDPFVKVIVDGTMKHSTEPQIDAGENATWDDVVFNVLCDYAVIANGFLVMEVWDKNFVSADKKLGEVKLPLASLLHQLNTEVVITADIEPQGCGRVIAVVQLLPEATYRRIQTHIIEKAEKGQ